MEVTLFHSEKKKAKPKPIRSFKDLTSVMAPVELLSDGKRQELLLKINKSSAFGPSRFDSLCLSLIHQVANHCQRLPESTNSYYSLPGGLIDHALNRTEAAVHLLRQYMVQHDDADLSEEQKLWLYALLSAGLLQGIGKLQIDYRIELLDANGQRLKQWQPLLETMNSVAGYYRYEFQGNNDDDLRRRLNLLLARQLMPVHGFAWIASNPQVLAAWLALLNEDSSSAGTLGAILDRADAIAIQRSLIESLDKSANSHDGRPNRMGTFIDAMPEVSVDQERLMGAEFIKWVTAALARGQFVINQPPFMLVAGGMLMTPEVFKFFARAHPEYKNWLAIQKGFLGFGLHVKGADGTIISSVEHEKTLLKGIVVEKYKALMPNEVRVKNLNTNEVIQLSAVELSHQVSAHSLEHLSLNGRWGPAEAMSAGKRIGSQFGG